MREKHPFPLRFALRVLAGKLELNALNPTEISGLCKLLRGLADGESVDSIFGLKNAPHRPKGAAISQRLFDVEMLRLPKKHGGEGMTKKAAIAKVAELHHVSISTVESDYKSDLAMQMHKDVVSGIYNPLALDEGIVIPRKKSREG
jgi:hypothetical protein